MAKGNTKKERIKKSKATLDELLDSGNYNLDEIFDQEGNLIEDPGHRNKREYNFLSEGVQNEFLDRIINTPIMEEKLDFVDPNNSKKIARYLYQIAKKQGRLEDLRNKEIDLDQEDKINLDQEDKINLALQLAYVSRDKEFFKTELEKFPNKIINKSFALILASGGEAKDINFVLEPMSDFSPERQKDIIKQAITMNGSEYDEILPYIDTEICKKIILELVNEKNRLAPDVIGIFAKNFENDPEKRKEIFGELLREAAVSGNNEVLDVLINNGADLNQGNLSGMTPLYTAIANNNVIMANKLIEAGADVYAVNRSGMTPLHLAIETGNYDMANKLIRAGANVNAASKSGMTPLHVAIENNYHNMVDMLIANQADPNIKDENGNTPLHLYIRDDNYDMANKLIRAGADINKLNTFERGPLYHALTKGEFTPAKVGFLNSQLSVDNEQIINNVIKNIINTDVSDRILNSNLKLTQMQKFKLEFTRDNLAISKEIFGDEMLSDNQKLAFVAIACKRGEIKGNIEGCIAAIKTIQHENGTKLYSKTSSEYKTMMDFDVDYIAQKLRKNPNKNIDFMSLIEKSPPEMGSKILEVAEKLVKMEKSPPGMWRKLVFNLTDFARGKHFKIDISEANKDKPLETRGMIVKIANKMKLAHDVNRKSVDISPRKPVSSIGRDNGGVTR